ncbi:MAG: Azospirillum phage Cd [Pseudomonadota bacterium]|jgi:hypothetical protein
MKDLHNNSHYVPVILPVAAAIEDNTAQVGAIVDHRGYQGAEYVIVTGTLADAAATFTALLEESDASDMTGATAVADADLLGTEALASFTQASDGKAFKLGYRGGKDYTRLTVTPAGNGAAAPIVAICHLGFPLRAPTANPPA